MVRCPKMLIGLEGAHAFQVSIFGGVEHLRTFVNFTSSGPPVPVLSAGCSDVYDAAAASHTQ